MPIENISDENLIRICQEAPEGQTTYVDEMRDGTGNTYAVVENGNCVINKSQGEIKTSDFFGNPETYLLTDLMDELVARSVTYG